MSEFFLWLEGLTFEEEAIFSVACIFALGLLMVPVAVWIDKLTHKED